MWPNTSKVASSEIGVNVCVLSPGLICSVYAVYSLRHHFDMESAPECMENIDTKVIIGWHHVSTSRPRKQADYPTAINLGRTDNAFDECQLPYFRLDDGALRLKKNCRLKNYLQAAMASYEDPLNLLWFLGKTRRRRKTGFGKQLLFLGRRYCRQ